MGTKWQGMLAQIIIDFKYLSFTLTLQFWSFYSTNIQKNLLIPHKRCVSFQYKENVKQNIVSNEIQNDMDEKWKVSPFLENLSKGSFIFWKILRFIDGEKIKTVGIFSCMSMVGKKRKYIKNKKFECSRVNTCIQNLW